MRWNPNGDMLASASTDNTVKLLDLKTGKILYSGTTSDQSKFFFYNDLFHSIIRRGYLCLFPVNKLYSRADTKVA